VRGARWCPDSARDSDDCYDKERAAFTSLYPNEEPGGLYAELREADIEINGGPPLVSKAASRGRAASTPLSRTSSVTCSVSITVRGVAGTSVAHAEADLRARRTPSSSVEPVLSAIRAGSLARGERKRFSER
jgi:hypothetical protein